MKLKKTTCIDVLLVLTRDGANPDMGFKIDGGKSHKEPVWISQVDKGSKAEECGIRVGDIVNKVHGVSVKNMTLEQVNRLFELDPRNISLKIKRQSEGKSFVRASTRSSDSTPVVESATVTGTPTKKRPHTICVKSSKSANNSNRTSLVEDNISDAGGCVAGKTQYVSSPVKNKMKRKKSIGETCRSFLDRIFRSKSQDQYIQNVPLQSSSVQANSSANVSFSSHVSSSSKHADKIKKKQSPEIDMAVSSPNNAHSNQNMNIQIQGSSSTPSVVNQRISSASTSSSIQNINSKSINVRTSECSYPSSPSATASLEKNALSLTCTPQALKGTSHPKAIIQISPSLKILNISSAEDPNVPTTQVIHSTDDCVVLNFSQSEIPMAIKSSDSNIKHIDVKSIEEVKSQSNFNFPKSQNYSVSVTPLSKSAFVNASGDYSMTTTSSSISMPVKDVQLKTDHSLNKIEDDLIVSVDAKAKQKEKNLHVDAIKPSVSSDVNANALYISEGNTSNVQERGFTEKIVKNYRIDIVEKLDLEPASLNISSVSDAPKILPSSIASGQTTPLSTVGVKLEKPAYKTELVVDVASNESQIKENDFNQMLSYGSNFDTIKKQPEINNQVPKPKLNLEIKDENKHDMEITKIIESNKYIIKNEDNTKPITKQIQTDENVPVPPRRNSKLFKKDQNLLTTQTKTDSEALDEMLDQAITQLQKDATLVDNVNTVFTNTKVYTSESHIENKQKSTIDCKMNRNNFFDFQYSLMSPVMHFQTESDIKSKVGQNKVTFHNDVNEISNITNDNSTNISTKEPLILYSRNALQKSKTSNGSEILGSPDSGFLSPTNDIIDSYVITDESQQLSQEFLQKQQRQSEPIKSDTTITKTIQTINDYDLVNVQDRVKVKDNSFNLESDKLSNISKTVQSSFSTQSDKKLINIVTPTPLIENDDKNLFRQEYIIEKLNDNNIHTISQKLGKDVNNNICNETVTNQPTSTKQVSYVSVADVTLPQQNVFQAGNLTIHEHKLPPQQLEQSVNKQKSSAIKTEQQFITSSGQPTIPPPSYKSVVYENDSVDQSRFIVEEKTSTFGVVEKQSLVQTTKPSYVNIEEKGQQQQQQQHLYDFIPSFQTRKKENLKQQFLLQQQLLQHPQQQRQQVKHLAHQQRQNITTDGIYEQIPAHVDDPLPHQIQKLDTIQGSNTTTATTTIPVYNVQPVEHDEFALKPIPLHLPGSNISLDQTQNLGTLSRKINLLDDQPHIRYLSSSSTSLQTHYPPSHHHHHIQQNLIKTPVTDLQYNDALKLELRDKLKNIGKTDESTRTAFEDEYFLRENSNHSQTFTVDNQQRNEDVRDDRMQGRLGMRNLEMEFKQRADEESKQKKIYLERIMEVERQKKMLKEKHERQNRQHGDYFSTIEKNSMFMGRIQDDTLYDNLEPPTRRKMTIYKGKAKALYNFKAQKPRELSLRKGDVVYLLKRVDKNWYEGEHHNMTGIFPVSYVEVVESIEEVHSMARLKEGSATVLYDFHPRSALEIALKKNHVVTLIRRVDDNWYEGRCGDRQGIFPVAYVSTMREPDTPLPTPCATPLPTPSDSRIHTPLPGWQSPSMFSICPDIPSAPMSPVDFSICNFSRESTPLGGGSLVGGPIYHPHRPSSVMSEPVVCRDGRIVPQSATLLPNKRNFFVEDYHQVSRKPPAPSRNTLAGYKQMPALRSIYDEDEENIDGVHVRNSNISGGRLDSGYRQAGGLSLDRYKQSQQQHQQQRLSSYRQQQQPVPKLQHLLHPQRQPLLHQTLIQQQQQLHQPGRQEQPSTMTFSSLRPHNPPSYSEVAAGVGLDVRKKSNKLSFAPSPEKEVDVHVKPILYPRYKALHAFTPRSPEELQLQKDDVVRVVERCKDGWFIGFLESNQQFGLFPGNFVEQIRI